LGNISQRQKKRWGESPTKTSQLLVYFVCVCVQGNKQLTMGTEWTTSKLPPANHPLDLHSDLSCGWTLTKFISGFTLIT
jgi:hypothetical protein